MLKRQSEWKGPQRPIDGATELFADETYQVEVTSKGALAILSVSRIDGKPIGDWQPLQDIKNELLGPECEGLELYPAESRVINTATKRHLWCCVVEGYRFPIGWTHYVG